MRLSHSLAPVILAAALTLLLPRDASALTGDGGSSVADAPGDLFGASCRTAVDGSHVVAYCHNPYVDTDRLRLHIECAQWWDIDTDTAPVDDGAAMTVRLTGRCWNEVASAWVSHQRAG
ncbi:hypothetical protein KUM39_11985 [Streptomyces sp. J2-1]|uniref:hypothetical protein n=1 Tax=Streptomyces corallincola TaxID=2851888 RepID=UPI001C3869E8|nr:hypothetical protein [Streptomyces corallincola]MBV2355078.1 hypothetical protein [Streptomyces corallincola]